MDIQKVIEIIERKTFIPNDGETFDDIAEAYDIAIDMLEKQVPQQVISSNLAKYCPSCGNGNVWSDYCPYADKILVMNSLKN